QTQLVDTDTELDPDESSSEAEESQPLGSRIPPHHVSPTSTPTRVSFHCRTVCMVMRTQLTLSPGMSARILEAATLSPSSLWDELGDEDTKEDESSDSDDKREGQGLDDEGHGLDDEGQGLEDEGRATSEPLGLGYGAARRRALESTEEISPITYEVGQSSRFVPEQEGLERISAFRQPTLVAWVDPEDDRVYSDILTYVPLAAPVQTLPSPECSLGSLPISPLSPIVPSPIASPVTTQAATISVDEDQFLVGIDRDLRELYTRSGAVRDEIFSQRYRFKSLKQEHERATMTFIAIWRPVLALEPSVGPAFVGLIAATTVVLLLEYNHAGRARFPSKVSITGKGGSRMNEKENSSGDRNIMEWTPMNIPGSKILFLVLEGKETTTSRIRCKSTRKSEIPNPNEGGEWVEQNLRHLNSCSLLGYWIPK
ncbi:hypothetical protein Tco_0214819, partial [Tanacetum coccineum]